MPFVLVRVCSPGDISVEGGEDLLNYLISNCVQRTADNVVKNTFVYSPKADSRVVGTISKSNMTRREVGFAEDLSVQDSVKNAASRNPRINSDELLKGLHELIMIYVRKKQVTLSRNLAEQLRSLTERVANALTESVLNDILLRVDKQMVSSSTTGPTDAIRCSIGAPFSVRDDPVVYVVLNPSVLRHPDSTIEVKVNNSDGNLARLVLHCSSASWAKAVSSAICARISTDTQIPIMNITLKTVQEYLPKDVGDSHALLEALLPEQTSVEFLKHVIILQSVYDSIEDESTKQSLDLYRPFIARDAADARRHINEVSANHSSLKSGFAFALKTIVPKPIGLEFPSKEVPDVMHARFSVYATKFSYGVVFSNTRKYEPVDGNHYKVLGMYINAEDTAVLIDSIDQLNSHILCFSSLFNRNSVRPAAESNVVGAHFVDTVHYHMSLDTKNRILRLEHDGSSAIFNEKRIEHKLADCGNTSLKEYRFVWVFSAFHDQVVTFSSIKLTSKYDDMDNPQIKLVHGKGMSKAPPSQKPAVIKRSELARFSSKKLSSNSSNGKASINIPANRIPCEDGDRCSFYLTQVVDLRQFENPLDHILQFIHTCRYDASECSFFNTDPNGIHARLYHHEELPICPKDRVCHETHDLHHRATFHHTKLPNHMYPCRRGANCNNKDSKHRVKFSHCC